MSTCKAKIGEYTCGLLPLRDGLCEQHFKQMHGVGTYDDLVWMTIIQFKLVVVQYDIHQYCMCFVKINDPQSIFRISNRGVRQNIFDCRNHISNWLNLDSFYCQYIVFFVHRRQDYSISNALVFISCFH